MFIGVQKIKKLNNEECLWNESVSEIERRDFLRELEWRSSKPQQYARVGSDEIVGQECVQAFISNMTAPDSLAELEEYGFQTLPENILSDSENEWTSPRWAKAGDIVFFMFAKTARTKITALRTRLQNTQEKLDPKTTSKLNEYIQHALTVHNEYGGKIFAVGRICGAPEFVSAEEIYNEHTHWKSRNYARIDKIKALENPVDISEFNQFITVSRASAITPLFNDEFDKLRDTIGKKNNLPHYVLDSAAKPIPLRLINDNNWIETANIYRRHFILEEQYRAFYVDYLIRSIGDQKKFFVECRCCRDDINDSFMDYVMLIGRKFLPVETKLSVSAEPNIIQQVSKYVNNSVVYLAQDGKRAASGNDFHSGKVLIIDTEKVYMYTDKTRKMEEIYDLNSLSDKSCLNSLRDIIMSSIGS